VATTIGETGWYAEIRIPFRTLKFTGSDLQSWGVNFERKVRRLNEDSYWSPLPRIYDLQRVSFAGTVEGLRGLRPGMNLRFKPYAASASNTLAGHRTTGDFDGGIDVKYGVTSGLVWDFTVNTDFSQVEADEQQVNLTRFNLFFPEKRDFFLENSGIFQFGGGGGINRSEMQLFFSPAHRPVGRRRCNPHPWRHPADGPAGRLLDWRPEHPAARAGRKPRRQLHGTPAAAEHPVEFGHRRRPPEQGTGWAALQPCRRYRRQLPIRFSDAQRLRGEDVFA
jgi:hypothetical protein